MAGEVDVWVPVARVFMGVVLLGMGRLRTSVKGGCGLHSRGLR